MSEEDFPEVKVNFQVTCSKLKPFCFFLLLITFNFFSFEGNIFGTY